MTPAALPLAFHWQGVPQQLAAGECFARRPEACFVDIAPTAHAIVNSRIRAGEPWQVVVATAFSEAHPWLYRIITDPSRDRFFRSIRPTQGCKVLDVGSGWGQQALSLAAGGNLVCAVEPNPDRMDFIRAVAAQTGAEAQLYYIQANLQEVTFPACFDVVTCIGVLEWAGTFCGPGDPVENQVAFLTKIRGALRSGGECIVGIENRMGLKYLLGARDDHTGLAGVSVLDYPLANERIQKRGHGPLTVVTHTESEYRALFARAGFSAISFHGAFPDYKVPEVILPCTPSDAINAFFRNGGFCEEHDGYDGSPLPTSLQEELRSHYRSLAALGVAPTFSPSFFITAS